MTAAASLTQGVGDQACQQGQLKLHIRNRPYKSFFPANQRRLLQSMQPITATLFRAVE